MSARLRAWRPGAVLVVAILSAASGVGAQGAKPSVDSSMTTLIEEIRQLRLSVERSSLITARMQALLGRVQLQESRLGDLGRRLDGVRDRLRQASYQETTAASEVAARASSLRMLTPGSEEHTMVEASLKASRERMKALQAEAGELRAHEQELSGAIASEQGRWQDYNARLETLERELADRRPSRPEPEP